MKVVFLSTFLYLSIAILSAQTKTNFNDTSLLQPVEVSAVRAGEKAPFAKTNINKQTIEKNNIGQDLPFILNQMPSVVVNSDAGTGVGYTSIHIRGTDASRINITLNGIPYNDAESQGTYFVDLPDFSSSVNSLQIQRGVGTSSNGAGAFGASINLSTNDINKDFYAELNNTYGSYNTLKNTLKFGSGLLSKHFTIDARLSEISSDGYIERATSNLKSFYFSTAYFNNKNSLRINVFSGKEKTYQAWNGVPEKLLNSDRTYNSLGTEKTGLPYANETDNYLQTHYQLFYNHKFNSYWKGNVAIFFTKGNGYYEEFKASQNLSEYGLPNYVVGTNIIDTTDLVRRLWLNNNFYGSIFSLQYHKNKTEYTFGGGYNMYDGNHYGEVIWAKLQAAIPLHYQWYNNMAHKKDFSIYNKWTQQWTKRLQTYVDIQFRNIKYAIGGFDDNPLLNINTNYNFINPKLGITYNIKNYQAYLSYARAQHEPNRGDFEANRNQQPTPEKLNDFELGLSKNKKNYSFDINLFFMKYTNQLILTGKINDVGSYTRTNVPKSFRAGIELQGSYIFNKWINVVGNISLTQNKIKNFTEYLDDYDNGGQQSNFYKSTDIALSPNKIFNAAVNITPIKNGSISFISKYVSRQYLDNTTKTSRSLNSYFVQDVKINYLIQNKKICKAINIFMQLNNIFNKKYEPNGYSYSYIYGGNINTENYYFPMATFNVLAGVNFKF